MDESSQNIDKPPLKPQDGQHADVLEQANSSLSSKEASHKETVLITESKNSEDTTASDNQNESAKLKPSEKKKKASPYMQNRELSWLTFNERVLDQGADPTVPLLERLNFVSIFWSNLQEFFMIRVGSLTDLSLVKKRIVDNKTTMTPSEQLDAVYARCHELYPVQEEIFTQVKEDLSKENIFQLELEGLDENQRGFLHEYLHDNVVPFLSPQIINVLHPFPHLENGALYAIVQLEEPVKKKSKGARDGSQKKDKGNKEEVDAEDSAKKDKKEVEEAEQSDGDTTKKDKKDRVEKLDKGAKDIKQSKNLDAEGITLGIVPLPHHYERIIKLPGEGFSFILLENALELIIEEIFSMYVVKHMNVICVTRNADLDASEGIDENDEDYREHMKRILKKRARLAPVRLESRSPLRDPVASYLLNKLDLKEHQSFVTSVPLDMSYCFQVGSYIGDRRKALEYPPFTPQWPATLSRNRSIIEQVEEAELFLSYPYESMDSFVQLLREASIDPGVISIKITLYRLASQSHLAEALIAAAENGKEVTALFELRARFDENNNIEWSQRFEQAGAKVLYGFSDYKVHSKICCITRQTEKGIQYITQFGTGNYNEKTARLYTDMAFITTDETFGRDAVKFFRNMGLEHISEDYDILWVAPLQIKPSIIANIDKEMEKARRGEACGLFFKTNSVTDKDIIKKLSDASQAGVPVILYVRGICCLIPGVKAYTEQIKVVSVVGRLLEHSRIYGFGDFDSMRIYLSSADLMTRNMDRRIEIAWPILNEGLRRRIVAYLRVMLQDTAKLRELLPDKSYTPLGYFEKEDAQGNKLLFDAQDFFIKEAQQLRLIAVQQEAMRDANKEDLSSQQEDEQEMESPITKAITQEEATALIKALTHKDPLSRTDTVTKASDILSFATTPEEADALLDALSDEEILLLSEALEQESTASEATPQPEPTAPEATPQPEPTAPEVTPLLEPTAPEATTQQEQPDNSTKVYQKGSKKGFFSKVAGIVREVFSK